VALMDINWIDHRQAHRQRLWAITCWRCVIAGVLGVLLSLLPLSWERTQRQAWALAWEAAQSEAQAIQSREATWAHQTQAWASWEAQRQAWLRVGHDSQTALRLWHWLGTATAHGVRWTQWQQVGQQWTVLGEANSLNEVHEWLVSAEHRPTPVDREVAVSQSHQRAGGRIGFVLTWEELP
jgi:hypothetical protein